MRTCCRLKYELLPVEPMIDRSSERFIDMTKNDNNNRREALSVQQVADELGYINKRTVIANIKAGLITGYKQPGRNGKYFVYREDLEEFIDI